MHRIIESSQEAFISVKKKVEVHVPCRLLRDQGRVEMRGVGASDADDHRSGRQCI